MPSSKAALTAKIAELEARVAAAVAEALTLKMELDSREAVIALQNGAMDEMGRIIEQMPGGAMAKLKVILSRHGVTFRPERKALS